MVHYTTIYLLLPVSMPVLVPTNLISLGVVCLEFRAILFLFRTSPLEMTGTTLCEQTKNGARHSCAEPVLWAHRLHFRFRVSLTSKRVPRRAYTNSFYVHYFPPYVSHPATVLYIPLCFSLYLSLSLCFCPSVFVPLSLSICSCP